MKFKILIILIILLAFISGCSEENTKEINEYSNEDVIESSYCNSSSPIGRNGCPLDFPVCVNNETCVAG